MPRLGYTKSRTGCLRCRQRRVKCDEKRPCTACTRHHVPCSLITDPPVVADPAAARDAKPKPSRTRKKAAANAAVANLAAANLAAANLAAANSAVGLATTFGANTGVGPLPLPTILDQLPAITTSAALSPDSSSVSAVHSPSSSRSAHTPSSALAAASTFPLPPSSSSSSSPPLESSPWAADLGLMHHYCTVTSLTLPRANKASSIRHVWQTVVVELALMGGQDLLLHQLLAVAAFHLAQLQPRRRKAYSILASQHQGEAAQKLRGEVGRVTAENCHVIFATSSLLIIGGYAAHAIHQVPGPVPGPATAPAPPQQGSSPHDAGSSGPPAPGVSPATTTTTTTPTTTTNLPSRPASRHQPTIDDLLGMFMLSRGMNTVLMMHEPTLHDGPLTDMFMLNIAVPPPAGFLTVVRRKLDAMQRLLAQDTQGRPMSSSSPAAVIEATLYSFVTIIDASLVKASEPELRLTMLFPIAVSEAYLDLLRAREPMALAVFAYHVAVMHRASQALDTWYLRGFGPALADGIEESLRATEARVAATEDGGGREGMSAAWKATLDWPLQFIRGQITVDA